LVGLEILVDVSIDKRREFIQSFEMLSRPERREAGRLTQSLFEDQNVQDRFLWMEEWASPDVLEAYLKTENFRTMLGAIKVLGTLKRFRKVEFVQP